MSFSHNAQPVFDEFCLPFSVVVLTVTQSGIHNMLAGGRVGRAASETNQTLAQERPHFLQGTVQSECAHPLFINQEFPDVDHRA